MVARLVGRLRNRDGSGACDLDVFLHGLIAVPDHVCHDAEVANAVNLAETIPIVLQAVHEPYLEATREGLVDFFQPPVGGDILYQARHRSASAYFQACHRCQN